MSHSYKDLENEYPDTIILMLRGSFYNAYDDSAKVLSMITGYKVRKKDDQLQCGFPATKSTIEKVISSCTEKRIPFAMVTADEIKRPYEGDEKAYKNMLAVFDESTIVPSKEIQKSAQRKEKDKYTDDAGLFPAENSFQTSVFITGTGISIETAAAEITVKMNELIKSGVVIDDVCQIGKSSNSTFISITVIVTYHPR